MRERHRRVIAVMHQSWGEILGSSSALLPAPLRASAILHACMLLPLWTTTCHIRLPQPQPSVAGGGARGLGSVQSRAARGVRRRRAGADTWWRAWETAPASTRVQCGGCRRRRKMCFLREEATPKLHAAAPGIAAEAAVASRGDWTNDEGKPTIRRLRLLRVGDGRTCVIMDPLHRRRGTRFGWTRTREEDGYPIDRPTHLLPTCDYCSMQQRHRHVAGTAKAQTMIMITLAPPI